jgi:hypothetical protein
MFAGIPVEARLLPKSEIGEMDVKVKLSEPVRLFPMVLVEVQMDWRGVGLTGIMTPMNELGLTWW